MMTLSEFIKQKRKKNGLSQVELAERAGVGLRFVRELEQGKQTLRMDTTTLKPDYFVRDVGLDWIVFPHEIEGLTDEEIVAKDPELAALVKEAKK